MRHLRQVLSAMILMLLGAPLHAGEERLRMQVACERSSAFVNLTIENDRRIGKVVIEVRDTDGRLWYREEGKAFTGSLVRRLDKGALPKGRMTMTVKARNMAITQEFMVH